MLIIACKLHSNTQTSELKNAACPGILLDNKVPTTNEICFDIFLLFTAQLYPRLNTYYQESLVLQTSEGQSCYLCCWETLTSRSRSFLWATSPRNLIWDCQNLPQGSSSLTKITYHTLMKTLFWRYRLILPLYFNPKWINTLYLYLSLVCTKQTKLTSTCLLNYMAENKTPLSRQRKFFIPADIRY